MMSTKRIASTTWGTVAIVSIAALGVWLFWKS